MPSIDIPLHTVMELTPKADGTMAETRFIVDVDKAREGWEVAHNSCACFVYGRWQVASSLFGEDGLLKCTIGGCNFQLFAAAAARADRASLLCPPCASPCRPSPTQRGCCRPTVSAGLLCTGS